MESRYSPGRDFTPLAPNEVTHRPLLRQGLDSILQGNFDEGISLLAQARTQLTPEHMHLASILDKIAEGYTAYCQLHEALLQAEGNVAKADSEQQTELATLNKLLSASEEAINTGQFSEIQASENSQLDQSPQDSGSHQSLVPSRSASHTFDTLPGLYVTCFGRFEVYRDSQQVELCANRNGQTILRYLVAQPGHCATADRLMGILWPEDEQEVARHKVHVAISALRGSLNRGYECIPGDGYILYTNRTYRINPAVALKTDVDEFLSLYQAGRDTNGNEMATLYERACQMYMGPFLVEDMYADWSLIRREQLSQTYLTMCCALADYFLSIERYEDTVKWANTILSENQIDEAAYRQLMLAYAAQGHLNEALRQYQHCEQVLRNKLGVSPMPETLKVFQAIVMRKQMFSASKEIEQK
jgi:DNA-binding SARP family transcriptional activator